MAKTGKKDEGSRKIGALAVKGRRGRMLLAPPRSVRKSRQSPNIGQGASFFSVRCLHQFSSSLSFLAGRCNFPGKSQVFRLHSDPSGKSSKSARPSSEILDSACSRIFLFVVCLLNSEICFSIPSLGRSNQSPFEILLRNSKIVC
ncbi:hypothetical protein K2173_005497 [Erythroxylum novogranatense]|uniref:Uncharacterized protein n=1 Tax=Erythroxylum novogranatense TaxID=1862640 RepID=A0AAV8SK80_9ROSI|nr:hypothetical protein K2173_005497 [Erythroxylum novogranatense]